MTTLLAMLLAAAAPPVSPPTPPEKISTLVVYGSDPCPRSSDDEIVVCARQPESERYRIPRSLRSPARRDSASSSWAGTARVLEMVSRQGLPNSCNATGTNGQTGCFARFLADARAQREADRAGLP